MRQRLALVGLTACSLLSLPCALLAQDDGTEDPEIGGGRLHTTLRSVGYYTDNFYNQPDDTTASIGTLLNPQVGYVKDGDKVQMLSGAEAEYATFDLPGAEDDYLDFGAGLKLAVQATLRNQLRVDARYKRGHDAFGVDRTEDATVRDDELDKWNQVQGALHYRYGAPGARINAEVGIGSLKRHYVTNRVGTEPLSYDSSTADYALFYNYSPKTSALIDFSRESFDFERNFGVTDTRGGVLYRVRTGARWLATGKTTGDVRVGYRQRTFDIGTPDLEGVDWEASVDWSPVPRSELRFATAYTEQESYRADARVIDVQSASVTWKHNLSARMRTTVMLEKLSLDFDTSGRTDDVLSGAVGAEYIALSNLWVVGSLGSNQRDSTDPARDYDRLTAWLGVRLGR